jgi:hypothetical protein
MSIKIFVESVVQQITIQGQAYNFAHGEKDWQNIFADEQSYPVVYLDEPISNDFDVVSSGAIEEYYPIKLMFLYKTELEFTPTQHDNEIQKARLGARKFITLCNQSEDVRTIKNAKGIEVINVFDANTSGVILSLDISFYNQESICADFDPTIGFVNLSNSNDTWQHQQINNSNYIVPNTIFEIFDQNEISYGEYSIPSVNGGQVIITVNPCDVATFQNSDGSFIQEIASGDTYTSEDVTVNVYDQNENLLGTVTNPSNVDFNVVVELEPCPPIEVNAEAINSLSEIVTTAVLTPINNQILAPDGIVHIKKENDGTIANVSTPSGNTTQYIIQNNDITVNLANPFSIHAEDSLDIRLHKANGNDIPPSSVTYQGNQNRVTVVVPNSVITLKDSSGTTISTTNVQATETANITAPDGAITVNGSSVGSVKSNGSRALLVKYDGVQDGTFDGVNTINLSSAWKRNPDWLALDTVTTGSEKFSGLFAVYETQKNVCTIQITTGTRTINWGDGTTQSATSGTLYTKVYDYATISSPILVDEFGFNYKMVVVNIPMTSATQLYIDRNTTATLINNGRSLNWLDIALDCSTLTNFTPSAQGICNKLERMLVYNVGATLNANSNFIYLNRLEVIRFPFEKLTAVSSTFTPCFGKVRDESNLPINITLTNATTSLIQLFKQSLFSKLGNISAPTATQGNQLFIDSVNLKSIGSINLPLATNIVSMFSGCINLESVVTITITSVCTSMASLGDNAKKCRGFIISNCSGITTTTSAFNGMVSMETLILTGMTRGFTIDDCNMSATAIDALFTSLGTASGAQTINVRRNPGSATCTTSIATSKGYTVVIA